MSHLLKKAIAFAVLSLLILWAVGLGRVATASSSSPPDWSLTGREEATNRQQVANNLRQLGLTTTPLLAVLDRGEIERVRVHEKSAQITSTTKAFDDDEGRIRAVLTEHKATVFHERNVGLKGQRRLTMEVGVSPERFDDLVQELRTIGRLRSINVLMRDRTDELRRLHAQRLTLKQHLEAVTKLRRAKAASVEDELRIEQKVQDIEKELQVIGVQMGDLLGKESFYHVYLGLTEDQFGSFFDRADTLPRHLALALLWALPWWLTVMGLFVAVPSAWISIQTLRGKDIVSRDQ